MTRVISCHYGIYSNFNPVFMKISIYMEMNRVLAFTAGIKMPSL